VTPTSGVAADRPAGRWRILTLLAVAELLGMSLWFGANAIAPELSALWSLDVSRAGWLTTIVQLGFVVGTAVAALLNLADIVSSRHYFATAAVLAGIVNLALLVAPGFEVALLLRFATGFFLAGVYPPGMKMIATWFRAERGLAIGTLVGALAIGKGIPYLVRAFETSGMMWVILATTTGAFVSAGLVLAGYREGPFPFERRPFSWSLARTVVRERQWRLATGGYLGHMWELYSFWTWLPGFLAASLAAHSLSGEANESLVQLLTFATIALGGVGCIWGGRVADRIGHERFVIGALATSGACCLAAALIYGQPLFILLPVAFLWGMSVVTDSAQFSTLVTRSVPPHAVGTALTLQTSLGFLLTMISMQLVPIFVAQVGWRWAFTFLAIGPAFGIAAIARLLRPAHRPS
jgi:MFS family permease